MGIGPGDPDLLTLRAVRLLKTAEVVLHDDQVAEEILELVPASAQVRSVSKVTSLPGKPFEKLQSLLIVPAREGHQVVRLRAGDPAASTHVDGEIEALAQAGVEIELISGASSPRGSAARAGSR